jgi:hypothetical protein
LRNGSSLHVIVKGEGKQIDDDDDNEEEEEEEESRGVGENVTLRVVGARDEGPDKLDSSVDAKSMTSSLSL